MKGLNRSLKELVDSRLFVLIGLGNPDRGDDVMGVWVAKKLKNLAPKRVFEEDEGIEGIILDILKRGDVGMILFLDTVDFGGHPGELRLFSRENLSPSIISTHKIPLRPLMELLGKKGKESYLLGVQPRTLDFGSEMSDVVEEISKDLISHLSQVIIGKRKKEGDGT
ncbi:hydrogenase maturation protease [candidate division KSB1 bacterium]|nr:hydrogenase maturation protease [candidate division KSB1 bacterium]